MVARFVILLISVIVTCAQEPQWTDSNEVEYDVEKRYTPELISELQSAKDDALLLYTEYSARTGGELKNFLKTLSVFSNETLNGLSGGVLDRASETCRSLLHQRLKKIEYDAHRAASFSAENHHKFILGHMIVFRIHLNKSEDYINKCDRVIKTCGIPCETTTRLIRWRRLAMEELNRVRDDLQHSRKSYKDLVTHARRKLNHLRRQANSRGQEAIEAFTLCNNRS